MSVEVGGERAQALPWSTVWMDTSEWMSGLAAVEPGGSFTTRGSAALATGSQPWLCVRECGCDAVCERMRAWAAFRGLATNLGHHPPELWRGNLTLDTKTRLAADSALLLRPLFSLVPFPFFVGSLPHPFVGSLDPPLLLVSPPLLFVCPHWLFPPTPGGFFSPHFLYGFF